jgi:hypothetical protein
LPSCLHWKLEELNQVGQSTSTGCHIIAHCPPTLPMKSCLKSGGGPARGGAPAKPPRKPPRPNPTSPFAAPTLPGIGAAPKRASVSRSCNPGGRLVLFAHELDGKTARTSRMKQGRPRSLCSFSSLMALSASSLRTNSTILRDRNNQSTRQG